uniref:Platelet activating factor acetylhydrolase 1b catalytic subunit 3 n=1 Tax=Salmo trutta TaxID=8032 RepID=A0A674D006_SALTR
RRWSFNDKGVRDNKKFGNHCLNRTYQRGALFTRLPILFGSSDYHQCLSYIEFVVVLWVGTHNHGHTAEQICGGIMAIVQLIKDKLPKKLPVLSCMLPRGKMPNPLRERNARVNKLVQEDVISHQDLYDFLHLTPQGYQAVCQPLHAHLTGLLEKQAEN